MEKSELNYVVDFVFEHYLDSDLDDDQREQVQKGYEEIKRILNA